MARKYVTKEGAHGTLTLFAVQYTCGDDPEGFGGSGCSSVGLHARA